MRYQYWMARTLTNAKIQLFSGQKMTAEDVWGMSEKALSEVKGLPEADKNRILTSRRTWNPEEEWQKFQEKGISFTNMEQENYPEKLKRIVNAPYALYYIGELPDPLRKQVAIVGARGRSAYGNAVARDLGQKLGQNGIEVISGMALGIDTDGHMGAIEGGGKTYAVLGCGPDVVYPKQNTFLYEKIRRNGGIISEYPPGTPPIARQFPARNRIISGFSDKVVVVEAKEKSGSLITADFAMEQGRDVYAVPGRITDPLSQGCNRLIQQGAGPLISTADFLKEMELETGKTYVQLDFMQNILEEEELCLYSILDYQPMGIGALMERTGLELPDLLSLLEKLKGKGMIRECATNYWVRAGLGQDGKN